LASPRHQPLRNECQVGILLQLSNAAWEIPNRNVYNPKEQPLGFGLTSLEDGKWLVEQNERGHKVNFEFVASGSKAVGIPSANSGSVAGAIDYFSSQGLTVDSRLKPEISAPGGSFLPTYPTSEGGTSTLPASPLSTSQRTEAAPKFPAMPATRPTTSSPPAASPSLIMMEAALWHAGIVDAFKVITYKTSITPAVINLNDTDHFQGTHEIKIDNRGNETVEYNIVHDAGSTISTEPASDPVVAFPPIPYSSNEGEVATVKF
ncbi:peptidase, partial [Colletotrichum cuscutae]